MDKKSLNVFFGLNNGKLTDIAVYSFFQPPDSLKKVKQYCEKNFIKKYTNLPSSVLIKEIPWGAGEQYEFETNQSSIKITYGYYENTDDAMFLLVYQKKGEEENPF